MGADTENPGGEAGLALEIGQVRVDAHESFLRHIPGKITVFDDPERHGVHLFLVADDERAERLGVAGLGSRDEREVVCFHGDGCASGEIHRTVESYHTRCHGQPRGTAQARPLRCGSSRHHERQPRSGTPVTILAGAGRNGWFASLLALRWRSATRTSPASWTGRGAGMD